MVGSNETDFSFQHSVTPTCTSKCLCDLYTHSNKFNISNPQNSWQYSEDSEIYKQTRNGINKITVWVLSYSNS